MVLEGIIFFYQRLISTQWFLLTNKLFLPSTTDFYSLSTDLYSISTDFYSPIIDFYWLTTDFYSPVIDFYSPTTDFYSKTTDFYSPSVGWPQPKPPVPCLFKDKIPPIQALASGWMVAALPLVQVCCLKFCPRDRRGRNRKATRAGNVNIVLVWNKR